MEHHHRFAGAGDALQRRGHLVDQLRVVVGDGRGVLDFDVRFAAGALGDELGDPPHAGVNVLLHFRIERAQRAVITTDSGMML